MMAEETARLPQNATTLAMAAPQTPKYDNPPVVETVLGVQFPELPGFRASHFGLYWNTIKDEYPTCEDRLRLNQIIELFPQNPPIVGAVLNILPGPAAARVWYTGKSETELIQLQPNRFLFNWRRRGPTSAYQEYEKSSKRFLTAFAAFGKFCRDEHLDEPKPEYCEVTYINHILPQDGETAISLFARVFAGLSWESAAPWLPTPEKATFNRTYVIEQGGKKLGRLYAEAGLAYRQDKKDRQEFVLLKMTARARQQPDEDGGLAGSLQIAHDWVVNGFAALTTPEMQTERWEKTQ